MWHGVLLTSILRIIANSRQVQHVKHTEHIAVLHPSHLTQQPSASHITLAGVRATHGITSGRFWFSVRVLEPLETTAANIGESADAYNDDETAANTIHCCRCGNWHCLGAVFESCFAGRVAQALPLAPCLAAVQLTTAVLQQWP